MDERKRNSMVAYLRRRMQEFGIAPEDLAIALACDEAEVKSARYISAAGDAWDGKGDMPAWLLNATSAGQAVEHFAASHRALSPGRRASVDWRDDPFAGTRLASTSSA